MACKTSYELHHHFPRVAEESGFTFNTHRPRVHINWNKIKLIDIDNLIRERKFVVIEQHLNDILDCVFESEFDVRILDEGVMKMFRLAQLAVEYQQFCRHYLDRSVFVLREEINTLAQDLDTTKKQLQEKEEELRKLKRRPRHSFRTPLPYGNDNIAAMILKTLSNKGDIFPSTSNPDTLQHNKCHYCEKVFLNQLYLQSHITRRHADAMDGLPKENRIAEPSNENLKLSVEVMELKAKLKDMEQIIINANSQVNKTTVSNTEQKTTINNEEKKNMKDAEVSTNNEEYLLNRFDEWKKSESEKYHQEINSLKTQVLETINSLKEKQATPQTEPRNSDVIEQLQNTIVQQGAEILALKHELNINKLSMENQDQKKKKEMDSQIAFWSKKAEEQAHQYEVLLQKMNDVAKEAKDSRAIVLKERERAAHLQSLLEQNLNRKALTVETSTDDLIAVNHNTKQPFAKTDQEKSDKTFKSKNTANRQTLENLHKKAQELLHVGSISSSLSDSSSSSTDQIMKTVPKQKEISTISKSNTKILNKVQNNIDKCKSNISNKNDDHKKVIKTKERKEISKPQKNDGKEKSRTIAGSPMRVVRAKITEEVNNRMVSFGADPLKSRLPLSVYKKQRMELQRLHEIKAKKNPSYEKIKYNILANLDSKTEVSTVEDGAHVYVSPNKINKHFRNITSVISNVKSKALSLVKLNDNNRDKRKAINGDVNKRAMTLLSTPPESELQSPINLQNLNKRNVKSPDPKVKSKELENKTENKIKLTKAKNVKAQVVADSDFEESIVSDLVNHNHPNLENSKSIDNLIKSPARRPLSADRTVNKYKIENGDLFTRTQSAMNLTETTAELVKSHNSKMHDGNSSDDVDSLSESPIKKGQFDEDVRFVKQTKGVLKNASSTSSLNKKKVLFDMDAIQMKSVSASPSQSITEKSDGNEKYELGLVNLDGEEWDISSIENEPLKIDTKIQVNTRTSPKIAELKHAIESQLARRNDAPVIGIVGGVDILSGPIAKPGSIGGSNTSLGSSILDDSDGISAVNHKAFVKPRKLTEKDDSEIDMSEFSLDGLTNKNGSF